MGRRPPPREKPWNVRNARSLQSGPGWGRPWKHRAVGAFSQPSQGHRGAHTRHHLLALGSGLSLLEAFPGSQAGGAGAPPGLTWPLTSACQQHPPPGAWAGPGGGEMNHAELCSEPPGGGKDPVSNPDSDGCHLGQVTSPVRASVSPCVK